MVILAILISLVAPSVLGFRIRAWDATAQSNLRRVMPSVEAFKQDQGTYVGMTPAALQATYDPAIRAADYTFTGLTATSYCIQTASGLRTWRREGPNAAFSFGSCP